MKKYDIVIVGAGPAGMTAALNCLRAGKTVIVLESETIGGQIALSPRVENFPTCQKSSGADLMDKLFEQITNWGADFELEEVESIDKKDNSFIVKTNYNEYEAVSVILATGAKARHMGIEREEELTGKGVSYCALCDGAFYTNEDVVVIGDANTAIQYALVLSGYCKSVQICTLFDKFFADKALLDLALSQPNVKYEHNLSLKELVGGDELSGLVFDNTKDKSLRKFDCKCVFICIGQAPNNKKYENLVTLDKNGFIIADESCKSSCEGIFAAGDCRTKSIRQLITAAADGSTSAFFACQYVDKIKSL